MTKCRCSNQMRPPVRTSFAPQKVRVLPKILTPKHPYNRILAARELFQRYETEGESFLDSIVTGDETLVCHYSPESKKQSVEMLILVTSPL